jgi:hypothetical protein
MDAYALTRPAGAGRRLIAAAAAWIGVAIAARLGLEVLDPGSPWRLPLALAPLPPFLLVLRAVVVAVRGLDEMGRRMHLEALAIAFPLATVLLMVLGLLELAVVLPEADWSYRHVWYWLPVFYFAGLAIAARRYR